MKDGLRWRLSMMMALVYAVQGAWWPLLAVHLRDLGISGRPRGWMFATLATASIVTPLWAGHAADRRIATQRLLSLIYGLGTGFLVLPAVDATRSVGLLLALFLAYWLVTAPVYSLSNSLAFRNLTEPEGQFGAVRLWGTAGWMAAGWVVTAAMAFGGRSIPGNATSVAFWVAAVVSGLLALYCLTLPDTPPLASHVPAIEGEELRELLRRPGVAVFLLTALGASMTTPFVYQAVPPYLSTLGLNKAWVASAMTLGQVLEIASLAALPWLLRRFGQKATLAAGLGAWVVYHGVLALRPPLVVALTALPMNGAAIALFHIAGPMFLDGQAPAHRRASVQGLYLVVTSGVGCLLGNLLAGEIVGRLGDVGPRVFLAPCLVNAVLLATFLAFFRARAKPAPLGPLAAESPGATVRASELTASR